MPERVGQQLGNYRLINLLGKGGFAEVYLGEHIYLQTPAAIKLLQTKVANEEDFNSFLTEAQTIAKLVHPHIVRILEFGRDGETPYLVMDYAPDGTLRQRHPRGTQLALTTIIPYVKQIAEALQYAHEEKFVHRDIKPENMLVGRRNTLLLSDFGIALIAQSSRYQATQDVIGTVAYMSPEQIQGRPRPASDQYSLAIVVYEWLTGDRPFHGSFTEMCTQHMFASPRPLRETVPGLPPVVEQVVMTALAKDPKQRFPSIQTFADALEQAASTGQFFAAANSASNFSPQPTIVQPPQGQPLLPTELVIPPGQSSVPASFHAQSAIPPNAGIPPTAVASPFMQGERSNAEGALSEARFNSFAPVGEVEPTHQQPPKRGLSRRTVVASLVGVGAAAIAVGGGVTWWLVSGNGSGGTTTGPVIDMHMGVKRFLPSVIRISTGSSIMLISDTNSPQTISNGMWMNGTPLLGAEPGAPVANNLTFNAAGQSQAIGPFNTAGTFHFCSTNHLGMNLTVIVQ